MPMPFENAGMPSWVPPAAMGVVPGYDQLLAMARSRLMKMMPQNPVPDLPSPPNPVNWADAGVDILSALSPDARKVIERLPPDARNALVQRFSRSGGESTPVQYSPDGESITWDQGATAGTSGGGGMPSFSFGDRTYGPGYGTAAGVVGMVSPIAGIGLEGLRRTSNVSRANTLRDMLGIDERPGWFSDFFSGIGKGDPNAALGTIDRGMTTTPVSRGGIASFTPQEAYGRQRAYERMQSGRTGGGGGRNSERSERDLDRESRGATGERTSQRGGMGGF